MKLLRILLVTSLLMSIFLGPSEGITALEWVMSGLMFLIICSTVVFILKRKIPLLLYRWLIFGLWVTLNIAVAMLQEVSLLEWARRSLLVVMWPSCAFLTFISIKSEKDIWSLYRTILIVLVIPLVIATILIFRAKDLWEIRMGTIWHEGIGHFALLALLLSVPFIKNRWMLVLSIYSGAILVLASVRSLLVGLGVGAVMMIIISIIRRKQGAGLKWVALKLGVVTLAAVILLLFIRPNPFYEAVTRYHSLYEFQSHMSFKERLSESAAVLTTLADKHFIVKLFGNGAGTSYPFLTYNTKTWALMWRDETYFHNFYIMILWNYGLIGLVLFLVPLFSTIWLLLPTKAYESSRINGLKLGLFLVFVVSGITANLAAFYDLLRFYILFGMMTGLTVAIRYQKGTKFWFQAQS